MFLVPFENVMKLFMKIFCLSFSFGTWKLTPLPCILSLALIIVRLKSALTSLYQKQPSRSVLRKMCSENMQQNMQQEKTHGELRFIELALWHGCSPLNLLHIHRTPFLKNTPGQLLLLYSHTAKSMLYFVWVKGKFNSLSLIFAKYVNLLFVFCPLHYKPSLNYFHRYVVFFYWKYLTAMQWFLAGYV